MTPPAPQAPAPQAPDKAGPGAPSMYFPTLDGLRFFAFFFVFVHHLPPSGLPGLTLLHEYGYVGVCIFLTLSAYLLTAILQAEHERTGGISAKKFYIRRGLRIWPLYYVFVLTMAAYARFKLHQGGDLVERLAGLLLFVDNILSGVRGVYSSIPCTGHLWTVALEEQFYLVLPFALASWLRARGSAPAKVLAVWAAFLVARAACVQLQAPHTFIWTSVISGDTILVGILLALLRWRPTTAPARLLCLLGGLVGVFSPVWLPPLEKVGPHQIVIYTTIAAGTGLLCASALHNPWLSFLGARPLRYLGKISYGLYVFHFLGMTISDKTFDRVLGPGWLAHAAGSLLTTVLLSVLSYELLEKRFLKLKARFETVHTRPV